MEPNEFVSIQDQIINDAVIKLTAKKEALLLERLNMIIGYIDLVAEMKRTFPRLKRILNVDDRSEAYYWNDGSETGQWVITFYPYVDMNISVDPSHFSYGFRYK